MLKNYLSLISRSILVIGPPKAGKTSMLWRLKFGEFAEHIKPTFGFSSDTIRNTPVVEIGGQETYKKYWQQALDQNPALTLFIIDVSREDNFKLFENFRKSFPIIKKFLLVANKIDLIDDSNHITSIKLKEMSTEIIFCSIRTGENFWRLSEYIAEFCSNHTQEIQSEWRDSVELKRKSSDTDEGADLDKAKKLLADYDGKF